VTKATTILLVEDQAIIALAQKAELQKRGYRVVVAESGAEALDLAASLAELDLVLMDIDLGPGMDGTEAAKLILAARELPLIFLSSHTEPAIVERTEAITSYGYVVKSAGITVLDASIKMAFRLFAAQRELSRTAADLHEKNQVLEGIMEHFPGSVFWKDRDSVYLGCNTEEAISSGASSPAEVIGKTDYELGWTDHTPEFYRDSDRAVMEGRKPLQRLEYSYHDRDGRLIWVETSKVPLFGEDGEVKGVFGVAVDITARKLKEEALRQSEARLNLVLDNIGACVFMKDSSYRYTYANRTTAELFGLPQEEIVGKSDADFFSPESVAEIQKSDRAVIEEGRKVTREENGLAAGKGEPRTYLTAKLPLRDASGALIGLCGISSDISDRKRSEDEIRRLLGEKDLLLQEVHHRVKNNLTAVRSMLDYQASASPIPEAAEALREAAGRVYSIALLYERLYQPDSSLRLSLAAYLPSLVAQVVSLFPAGNHISARTEVEDLVLGTRTMATLGIIVNELVTNAMKYAFEGRESGSLVVAAARRGDRLFLTVEDDGPGLPGGFEPEHSSGFGYSLIRLLCRELGGSLSIGDGPGTRLQLELEPWRAGGPG
jgi:PAS domain S-box-containing protein